MKEADWTALEAYIAEAKARAGLRDWTIRLERRPPTDEVTLAAIQPITDRKLAFLRVCSEFRALRDDEQRHVIAHELLHPHFSEVEHLLALRLKELLGESGLSLWEAVRSRLEIAIDAIATEWAGEWPPIAWTTPDPDRNDATDPQGAGYAGPLD